MNIIFLRVNRGIEGFFFFFYVYPLFFFFFNQFVSFPNESGSVHSTAACFNHIIYAWSEEEKNEDKTKTKTTQIFVSMFRNSIFFFLSIFIFMFIYWITDREYGTN